MLLVGIGRREKRIQKIFKKLKKRLDVTGIFGYNIFRPLRERIANMESWLSGRRRTIGNRVGVMSVSRVQIPDSPPDYRTLSKDKVRFLLFCEKIWYIFA